MTRILLRATKSPFDVRTARETLDGGLLAGNSGNLVFMEAAWKLLAVPGAEITTDGLEIRPGSADEINERYDAYVIPLANAFRVGYEPTLIRMTQLLRRLRIPVVVLGVGAQGTTDYRWTAVAPIERSVREFVAAVLDRSPAIGVRGEATFEYLRGLGFADVEVIGCPSMFLWGPRLAVERRVPALGPGSRVGITISPYRSGMGPIALETYERYRHLTYFAQDEETLELLLSGKPLSGGTAESSVPAHPAHPFFRDDRARLYLDPWPWMDDLRTLDFCFGTRIHGTIASLLAGTPATVLAHDSRTLELARYFDIPHRLLRGLGDNVDPADLYAEADFSALHAGHAARFAVFARFLAASGLDHVFNHAGAAEAFDARVAATRYPGPVTFQGDGNGGGSPVGRMRRAGRLALRGARVRSLQSWLARRP